MPAWLAALVGVPLLLVAAKIHGRQLRLEREKEGYHSVVFGGDNPAYVEELWRRDRIRYWILTPALALVAFVALLSRGAPLALVAALLGAPSAAFLLLGIASGARAQWPHARGTILWGALAALLAGAALLAAR